MNVIKEAMVLNERESLNKLEILHPNKYWAWE
jgi:hypothetical protein